MQYANKCRLFYEQVNPLPSPHAEAMATSRLTEDENLNVNYGSQKVKSPKRWKPEILGENPIIIHGDLKRSSSQTAQTAASRKTDKCASVRGATRVLCVRVCASSARGGSGGITLDEFRRFRVRGYDVFLLQGRANELLQNSEYVTCDVTSFLIHDHPQPKNPFFSCLKHWASCQLFLSAHIFSCGSAAFPSLRLFLSSRYLLPPHLSSLSPHSVLYISPLLSWQ